MATKPEIALVVQPEAFFHELVTQSMGRQKISVAPETEYYLVSLLQQFMSSDRLFVRDSEGHVREEPLALMLKEAIEQPQSELQRLLFRQVGDVSLYVSGFFQESLSRKAVDIDYYIHMGERAYKNVAARVEEKPKRAMFEELSDKFSRFVEVLADVSDKTTLKTEKNLLQIYELWQRTGSERSARQLKEAGINVTNAHFSRNAPSVDAAPDHKKSRKKNLN